MKTVSVSLLRSFFYPASKLGISKQALLDAVGLDEETFDNPEHRLPCRYAGLLLKAATEMSGDPGTPLFFGEHVQPTHFNVFGYLVLNAPTVKEAYRRCLDYQRIVGDGLHVTLEERDKTAHVWVDILDAEMHLNKNYIMDFHFANHVTLHRQLVGKHVYPLAVLFEHNAPESVEKHEAVFGCELHFNAKRYELVLPQEFLNESIADANPFLYSMFKQLADDILDKITDSRHLSWKVSQHLLDLIPAQQASLDAVASRLTMGTRTLQRKLQNEGMSFAELLTQVRRELAIQHLSQKQLSITEISYMLGFAEPSVFHRSFKKWTGQTPRDFQLVNHAR